MQDQRHRLQNVVGWVLLAAALSATRTSSSEEGWLVSACAVPLLALVHGRAQSMDEPNDLYCLPPPLWGSPGGLAWYFAYTLFLATIPTADPSGPDSSEPAQD